MGLVARLPGAAPLQQAVLALEPVGTAFIRLVTMVVVPLVISSLFTGVASLGDVRRLGRIGGRTLGYFLATTALAAAIGLAVALLMRVGQDVTAQARAALASGPVVGASVGTAPVASTFVQILVNIIPQNPFAAAAQADLLPLMVAVCLFAAAAAGIAIERRRALIGFCAAINDLCMVVIRWGMATAPGAVLILIAGAVTRIGEELLPALLWYALAVVVGLVAHFALVLMPLLRAGARRGPVGFFRAVSDALLLAFSTASSSATLPVSMAAARTRLGLPNEIVGFVLPAGATLNKNGAAAYKAITAVFIAQLYGVPLDAARVLVIVLASAMAAFAGAGIPGSSLVTTLIVLNAIGLGPRAAAGIALVAGIDRPLDMCRTTVNTIGNLVGAAFIARHEGT